MKCKRMVSGVLVLAGAWGGACLAGPREPAARGHDLQALTGPSFESLFRQAGQACPAARLRYASPADLLDAEDVYIAGLPAADKSRVAAAAPRSADGGYSACANRDGASLLRRRRIARDRTGRADARVRGVGVPAIRQARLTWRGIRA